MNNRTRPPGSPGDSLLATTAAGIALAAFAGLADVAGHGAQLAAGDGAATVLLWVALAAAPAAAAGLVAFGWARAARASKAAPQARTAARAAAGVLCAAVLSLAIAGAASRALAPPLAIAVGLAALGALGPLQRHTGWLTRSPPLAAAALVAAPLAAAGLGAWRSSVPRLPAPSRASAAAVAPASARAADAHALQGEATAARAQPDIVIVVLDTLRADHLGAYGDPRGLSPAFDALARDAALRERCFAPAPWTIPSHASLFTGLHPQSHGASFAQHRWLDARFRTLAEALREVGYRTAGFSANPQLALANLTQGFEYWEELGTRFGGLALRKPLAALGAPARWVDAGGGEGVRRIDRFLAGLPAQRAPLLLFVNLIEPHWRYLPPLRERRALLPPGTGLVEATRISAGFYGPLAMARPAPVPARTAGAIRALYAGEVRYQDGLLAQLFDSLDRRLARDQTLLLVTADHGENLGEGGRWDHVFAINDALIHVPMVWRLPGRFEAGSRSAALCSLVDVPATIADVVGRLPLEPRQAGRSLLAGAAAAPPTAVFAESEPYLGHLERMSFAAGFERDVARFAATLRAARGERFKYVESSRTGPRLYDLEADPDETRDVRAAHPHEAQRLARALARWRAAQPQYRVEQARRPDADAGADAAGGLDAADRARLEALGYAQ